MKVLSLRQPWAELILQGKKKIETRNWNTKFRGVFLIHVSKQVDKKSMERFGFSTLPTGCLVGKAELTDVKKYATKESFAMDAKEHLGLISSDNPWLKPRYGFLLKDVQRVNPIPLKGQLNFFEYKN